MSRIHEPRLIRNLNPNFNLLYTSHSAPFAQTTPVAPFVQYRLVRVEQQRELPPRGFRDLPVVRCAIAVDSLNRKVGLSQRPDWEMKRTT